MASSFPKSNIILSYENGPLAFLSTGLCVYVVIFRLIWQNVSGKFEYYADIETAAATDTAA